MNNLTESIISNFINMKVPVYPALKFPLQIVLSSFIQYISTFAVILVSGLILNKLTIKNESFKTVLESILGIIIFLPVLPIIFAFVGILFVIRTGVWVYFKVFYPDGKFSILNAADGFWAYEAYASCSTFIGLYIIEGVCDTNKIEKRIKDVIVSDLVGGKLSKRLTSTFGFACWEKLDHMDIKDYAKVVLDTGKTVNEKEVFEFLKSVQDFPFENKAPWEVNIIPKFAYENSSSDDTTTKQYAVIFRIHHSIMDGVSTGNMLHSVVADKPFKFSIDPTEPFGLKMPSNFETFVAHLLGILSVPRLALNALLLTDNAHNKYFSAGPQLTGPKTFTWSRPIRMDALKQIKNSTKTSVYSVLLTSLGGALRKLNIKNGIVIKSDYYHSMSPVALIPYPDRKPQNRFTGILVPGFVGREGGLEVNPTERLRINYQNLRLLFTQSNVIASWYLLLFTGLMPLFLNKFTTSCMHLKMSLSNIPGPSEPAFMFDGGKIVDIGAWVPIKQAIGLGVGLFSNGNRVRASIIGDRVNFPKESDVQFLTDAFEDELKFLANSIGLQENMLYLSK